MIASEASFEPEEEDFHQQQMQKLKQHYHRVILAIALSSLALLLLSAYFIWGQSQLLQNPHLPGFELHPFWQALAKEEETKKLIIEKGEHQISRQELGKMGWTLLHMISGSFPKDIPADLVKQFNEFLHLFGHMYPCKLCAGHFLQLLERKGPFRGDSKEGLMAYMC